MSLSSYKPKRETISVNDETTLSLRALSLPDVRCLIENHLQELDQLFNKFAVENQNVFAPNIGDALIRSLIADAPEIAARIVALSQDEPEAVEQAAMLPVPVLLQSLVAIGNLTFTEYGGAKKFFGTAMDLYQAIKSATPGTTPALKPNRKARRS